MFPYYIGINNSSAILATEIPQGRATSY